MTPKVNPYAGAPAQYQAPADRPHGWAYLTPPAPDWRPPARSGTPASATSAPVTPEQRRRWLPRLPRFGKG